MSTNASSNSSDGASAAASQLATSPFSPHATAFGPNSNISLGTSNRIHGIASDQQSLSSRASSFASAHDQPATAGFKSMSTAPPGHTGLPVSPFANADASSPSAGQIHFGDRMRNNGDHSRQSSGGNLSSFSTTSAAANALYPASSAAGRRTQSPLPQHLLNRNNSGNGSTDSLGHASAFNLNARSPTSLLPPQSNDDQQRRLSSSFGIRHDSPSLAPPSNATSGARPAFGRQSFSDGPSTSPSHLLSADPTSAAMDARYGSYSGSFPVTDAISPIPPTSNPMAAGLSHDPFDPSGSSSPAAAPTTGPLSASDPRTQLLVSNLPYRVRWQDLKDLFRKAGTVLRADVSLSADNRSRGYGTVLMATEQDAIKAADMLGGFTWQGRTLDVRVDRSGTLVGVAGSAVMPTLASNGAVPSPSSFGTGQMAPNMGLIGGDQGFGSNSSSSSSSSHNQFLGLPSNYGSSQAHSPGSFSGAASPSGALSPLARAVDVSAGTSARASFSLHSDTGLGGSEFERAMLQGQNFSGASGNNTPNRQRPGSGFETGFGGQGQQQQQHRALSAVHALNSNSRRGSEVGAGINGPPTSGVWGPGSNDAATSLYSQNAGGSSVPTGFPGATAMAPWPQGPGALGGNPMSSMQSQPFNSQMPTTSYAGRVLFVGNLPFHCQWQDLKDLFRAAGNIQRADVAIGPDGRSRGFGTVLFASQEDAQNAVRLYHGYEYSGRTLKVHFDRFAAQNGPAVGTPGNPAQYTGAFAAAALPSHMTNNVRAPSAVPQMQAQPMQGGFGQPQYSLQPMQHQQQRGGAAASMSFMPQQQQQQGQASFGQAAFQQLNPSSLQYGQQYQPPLQQQRQQQPQQQQQQTQQQQQQRFGQQPQQPQQQQQQAMSSFSVFADAGRALQGQAAQQSFSSFSDLDNSSQSTDRSGRRASTAKPFGLFTESDEAGEDAEAAQDNDYGMSITMPANGFGAASSYLPSDLMSPGLMSPPMPGQFGQAGSHPGRIQLPSANSFANSFGAADQMTPMTARMQVPMTPGMPGFTFHQVPQTPPMYPQFLSPGLGPFSPPLGGSSQVGGGTEAPQHASGYANVAPGASVNAPTAVTPGAPVGYNPMFPMSMGYGGAAIHQQQPATPHWSQPSGPRRGGGAPRQSLSGPGSHNPEADEVVDVARAGIAKTPGAGPRRPSHVATDSNGGRPSDLLARRASDGTPGAIEPSDGYPFPMVAAGNVSHLTRRASTNSPAATPLAGPAGSNNQSGGGSADAVSVNVPASELLAGASTEDLANAIARLSVKGTALAKEAGNRRSLSMTAERSAASAAMAKLREKASTPTSPPAQDENNAASSLGAPFGSTSASEQAATQPRLGLAGRTNSKGPSPLASSEINASQLQQQEPSQQERLLGVKMSNIVLEAARNGSALDTSSEAGGSSNKGTPKEEVGPSA